MGLSYIARLSELGGMAILLNIYPYEDYLPSRRLAEGEGGVSTLWAALA